MNGIEDLFTVLNHKDREEDTAIELTGWTSHELIVCWVFMSATLYGENGLDEGRYVEGMQSAPLIPPAL